MIIELTVNGTLRSVEITPSMRLLDMLRNVLGLTSVKEGCSEGECGACTVLLDGKAVTSCTVLAVQARGKSVVTIEGLSSDGALHPIQQAFVDHDAIQCGFCTPGMIMSAYALLKHTPSPTREEIQRGIEGNLCRCTGYLPIIDAIEDAARRMKTHES
ncbi:MAG: (2Fe-2S)-binding protein [Synergistetes bacterium HGW-Synergistetes-2]|nr:MAG: (2Fe-2S)-binding protein [Synergistetes bacterium HGW-Synergistetes-2]